MSYDPYCGCPHRLSKHRPNGQCTQCDCPEFEDDDTSLGVDEYLGFYEEDQTMVDLGGGMVVPLSELLEDDE